MKKTKSIELPQISTINPKGILRWLGERLEYCPEQKDFFCYCFDFQFLKETHSSKKWKFITGKAQEILDNFRSICFQEWMMVDTFIAKDSDTATIEIVILHRGNDDYSETFQRYFNMFMWDMDFDLNQKKLLEKWHKRGRFAVADFELPVKPKELMPVMGFGGSEQEAVTIYGYC